MHSSKGEALKRPKTRWCSTTAEELSPLMDSPWWMQASCIARAGTAVATKAKVHGRWWLRTSRPRAWIRWWESTPTTAIRQMWAALVDLASSMCARSLREWINQRKERARSSQRLLRVRVSRRFLLVKLQLILLWTGEREKEAWMLITAVKMEEEGRREGVLGMRKTSYGWFFSHMYGIVRVSD